MQIGVYVDRYTCVHLSTQKPICIFIKCLGNATILKAKNKNVIINPKFPSINSCDRLLKILININNLHLQSFSILESLF